jgi:hypothetical protein
MTLATLAHEVGIELEQQRPAAPVQCRPAGDGVAFTADPRRLVLAIVELVRMLQERDATGPCTLMLSGRPVADGVELHGELSWPTGRTPAAASAGPKPGERLEMLLAEELLAAFGAQVARVTENGERSRFTIHVFISSGHA